MDASTVIVTTKIPVYEKANDSFTNQAYLGKTALVQGDEITILPVVVRISIGVEEFDAVPITCEETSDFYVYMSGVKDEIGFYILLDDLPEEAKKIIAPYLKAVDR